MKQGGPLKRHSRLENRTGLKRRTPLAREGRRAKRNAPGDRQARAEVRRRGCICGCGRTGRFVDWSHLAGRTDSVRHDTELATAKCRLLHTWIHDTADGQRAEEILLTIAREEGRALTATDCCPTLSACGFYVWKARQLGINRTSGGADR